MSKVIDNITFKGETYEFADKEARGKLDSIPTKTSQLENDSNFITKADIPIDESYELIGQTPLTLDETSNIKLVADGETSYKMVTPTVWNFDNAEYTASNASLSTDKGYYEIVSTDGCTAWYNSYIAFVISGLEIGKSYNLICDFNGLTHDETNRVHIGSVTVYAGTDTKGTLLVSGYEFKYGGNFEFTATEENIYIRYLPVKNKAPFVGWVGHFNKLYLNYADASEDLTEIYNNSDSFTDVATFMGVPANATITTTPTADVYIKAPTDKTLTQSDVPADAEITGKQIAEVKRYLPLFGKTIVNFGDSIFGNARPPEDISTYLAEKTGAEVLNCAFGGCRMAIHNQLGHWNAFTMVNLAQAISSGDYSVQDEALNYDDRTSYAEQPLSVIKATDFSTVDILTIAYGTNDFTSSILLDNEENLYDTTTLAGALRTSIESLLTAYPNLRIFVLSLAYRFWIDDNNEFTEDSNTKTINGVTILDYNAKLKEVASEYNLPYVDDYNIGIGKFNRYQYFNANDGTHHKEEGRRLIAEHLASALTIGQSHSDSYTIWKAINEIKGGVNEIEAMIDESGVLE